MTKIALLEEALYFNPNYNIDELVECDINELGQIIEFEQSKIFEAYKKRNLTPIQFAKEAGQKLQERMKKLQDRLKMANTDKNADKAKELKNEISRVKTLITANKQRQKNIKEKD